MSLARPVNDAYMRRALQECGIPAMRVVPATVLYSIPFLNTYVVRPHHSVGFGPLVVASASHGATQYQDGVACPESYTPGTHVLIASPDKPRTDGVAGFSENHHVIVGAFALTPSTKDAQQHKSTKGDPQGVVDGFNNNLNKRAFEAMKKPHLLREYSYGQSPVDILPGDFLRHSPFGNGLIVSLARSCLYGGPLARLEFDPLDQEGLLCAQVFALQSLFRDDGHFPDKGDTRFYERRAYALLEGLGVLKDSAYKKDGKDYVPKEDDQIGYFRRETHEGRLADGLWTFHEIPEDGGTRTRSKAEKPPLGVFSERTFYEGLREARSIKGFSWIKAPWVPVLRELLDESDPSKTLEDDASVGPSYREYANLTELEYAEFAATIMSDEFAYNMDKVYGRRPRGRTKNWKIFSKDDVEGQYGFDTEREKTLELLDASENSYKAETPVTVEDPGTKEKSEFYSTASGIRQLPDGTIVISDGWGAELRMSHGNITISCANDIRILPGRDCVEMVPRNKVINAGVDLYAEASNGSMYLKAEHQLKALAGNAGSGALVLESRGVHTGEKAAGALSDTELNGGVVIKTEDGVAILGERFHVGSPSNGKGLTNGLDRQGRCDIMLDAGPGVLNLAGSTGYQKFDSGLALIVGKEPMATGIGMGLGGVDLFGTTIGLSGTTVKIAPQDESQFDVQGMDAGGVTGETFRAAASAKLEVLGKVQIAGSLDATGAVAAGECRANQGRFKNASDCSNLRPGPHGPGGVNIQPNKKANLTGPANAFKEGFPTGNTDSVKIHTGAYEASTGFYWKEDSSKYWADNAAIYAARWQSMLKDSGTWSEPPVYSPDGSKQTYAWPGKDAWTSGEAFVETTGKSKLTSYKTSVKSQKEHE